MVHSKFQAHLMSVVILLMFFFSFALNVHGAKEKGVKTEVYSYNVGSGSKIIIENEKGDISVEGWDKNTCEVNVFKSSTHPGNFDKIKIGADEQPNRLRVRTSYPDRLEGDNGVDYVISVPANVDLQLKTSIGKLQVRDFIGRLTLHTERGDMRLTNVIGTIEGRTEAGNIAIDLPTTVQSITLKTDDGSIKANVDKNANAFIWAEAEAGTIKSNLPLELVQANEPSLLKGQLGRGGKLIHLQVGRGSIDLVTPGGTGIAARPGTADDRAGFPQEQPRRRSSSSRDNPQARTRSDDVLADAPERSQRRTDSARAETRSGDYPDRPANHSGQSGQGGVTFNVETNLITLNATVKDRRTGRTISHLRKNDFLVYEDHTLQELAHFSPVDTPFNLLLLLDISGSVREQFHIIQEASIRFTERLRPKDKIAVAVFNSRFKLLADFTNDRRQLSRAILSASPGGGTAFYDAMYKSIDSVFRGINGRKAIVVFTDGVDNQNQPAHRAHGSRITFPELFRLIEETDITIYSIFLDTEADNDAGVYTGGGTSGDWGQIVIDILRGPGRGRSTPPTLPGRRTTRRSESELYRNAKEELNKMADQTGGQMYSPRAASDLNGVYQQIVDELSTQYSLGYYPANSVEDGKWRRLSAKVKNMPDYVVRTRRGYYANFRSQHQDALNRDRQRLDRYAH